MTTTNLSRQKAISLRIDDFSVIGTQLHDCFARGYGPSFQQTLVSTSTGKVLITNSGTQILKALHSNPIQKHIIDMVTFHQRATGDDSKTFIVLLSEILKRVALVAGQRHDMQLEMVRCFDEVSGDILPLLLKSIEVHCVQVDLSCNNNRAIQIAFSDLLSCSLSSQFLEYDAKIIIDLLNNMISSWRKFDPNSLVQLFNRLTDNFHQIFHEIPGRSVSVSKVVSGILLSRGFINNQSSDLFPEDEIIRFVLLDCPIETNIDENDTNATLRITNENSLESLIHHKRIRTDAFMQQLKIAKVTLLLTTYKLSSLEKTQCSRNGITAVHCVNESELQFLALMCSVEIIHDARQLIDEHISCATTVKQLSYGVNKFTNIVISEDLVGKSGICSLLLAGPTEGVTNQTSRKILDSLKVLKQSVCEFRVKKESSSSSLDLVSESMETLSVCSSSYKNSYCNTDAGDSGIGDGDINSTSDVDSPSLNRHFAQSETNYHREHQRGVGLSREEYNYAGHLSLIPAGGTFEICLYVAITQHLANHPPTGQQNTALTILREALLAVPRLLHENAYYFDKPRWVEVMNTLTEEAKYGTALGVDPIQGTACKIQACHPFNSKCQLVSNVLSAARQLLRLDQIA